jgi:uncharacterized RDD family membrane protein YckC
MTSGLDCVEEAAGGPVQEREAVGRAPLISPATRAGVVTRTLAAAVDVALAAAMVVLVYLAVVATRFAWSPLTFRWPTPSAPLSGAVFAAVATVYLTVAWAGTGRTRGGSLLGLRVVSTGLGPLGWWRAAVRAVAYIVFPVGLLWSAVSPHRRSVQDALVGSLVVYDGHHDGGARLTAPRSGR